MIKHLQHTLGGVALRDLSSKMVGIIPLHFTQVTSRGRLTQAGEWCISNTNTVSRVEGVWRHRGGTFLGPMLRHVLAYSS
jgi:hypothetical protein